MSFVLNLKSKLKSRVLHCTVGNAAFCITTMRQFHVLSIAFFLFCFIYSRISNGAPPTFFLYTHFRAICYVACIFARMCVAMWSSLPASASLPLKLFIFQSHHINKTFILCIISRVASEVSSASLVVCCCFVCKTLQNQGYNLSQKSKTMFSRKLVNITRCCTIAPLQ